MRKESRYYGNVMKKYAKRDGAEWIIGIALCIIGVLFIPLGIFLSVFTGAIGVCLLSYCSGKDAVTLRMLNEDITEGERLEMLKNQHKMW